MPQSFHHELLRTLGNFIVQLERDLAKFPSRHLGVFHGGRHGRVLYVDPAVDERKQTYFPPEILELAGHLKSNHASAGKSGKMDRTFRLLLQNFPNIVRGEGPQAVWLRSIDKINRWLDAEYRAVRRKL